ncbi:hypothetical protein VC0395_A1582 [Vibrio cholerae O395]|uniref:Uncharacterized protein n=1 Tax=Vibrio cholerae serotype O1 (strain ATCC 39541 / Classical Ogawa 395 / O395) TaxID=345073 RepID=A0A0H3AGK3_VIBC3|nr:hypothetical protein VC0395_A1582 [Vibrio cholerae O395]APF49521.1 hypothetical protein ASZ80_01980 [Vibrio cholerae]EAZ72040.1 hypothetical protein A5C_2029 [Vibrio cholerae NCTC 8457]EET92480.1 hypothetical protein VCH_001598 [Vibrio cholerae CIRS101]EGS61423.1 hypothetical protein VCHC02A1_2155 [Vibrio cholerae HC-02A1]EJH64400.1 hypothetical protein VCHE45_2014 [Vibrio cholerae HE-45]EKG45213.1 hypothetical protein VCHC39A1_2186 [Vibrio cholerae HC-39A1]EKL20282.1 hypothetical protein
MPYQIGSGNAALPIIHIELFTAQIGVVGTELFGVLAILETAT